METIHLMRSRGNVGIQMEYIEELCSKFLVIQLGWKELNSQFFQKYANYILQNLHVSLQKRAT